MSLSTFLEPEAIRPFFANSWMRASEYSLDLRSWVVDITISKVFLDSISHGVSLLGLRFWNQIITIMVTFMQMSIATQIPV